VDNLGNLACVLGRASQCRYSSSAEVKEGDPSKILYSHHTFHRLTWINMPTNNRRDVSEPDNRSLGAR